MTVRLTEIVKQKRQLIDDTEARKMLDANIQSGLDNARQILDFMEDNIQTVMTTRNCDRWGFIFHELLLSEKQLEEEIKWALDDLMEYSHTVSHDPSVNELFIDPYREEVEYASNVGHHRV